MRIIDWIVTKAPFFSLIVSIFSLMVSIAIFVIGYLLQARARKIQALTAWNSYREPIRKFADEAIEVLSKVEALCEVNPEIKAQDFWDKYNEYIGQISSLRDRGKLLLPNHAPSYYGQEKSSAYQGIRQAALDCLTAAFRATVAIDFSKFGYNKTRASLVDTDAGDDVQLRKLKGVHCPNCPRASIFKGTKMQVGHASRRSSRRSGNSCPSARS